MPLAERFELAALCNRAGRRTAARLLHGGMTIGEALRHAGGDRGDAERLADLCQRHRIDLVSLEDDRYPDLLRAIADPPLILYIKGTISATAQPAVAVVGARRCTRLGADVADRLAGDLARRGVTIVSGLARGIDTAAHRAALENGCTVAVLGSGLVTPYPVGSRNLASAIPESGGLLVSEYPPLAAARKHHFPERNRLISGMSVGVVVVEAGEHSGSLITARMALEQGREVLAVPGPVTSPVSRGCHRLLRQGAALVESAGDVIECLGLRVAPVDHSAQTDPNHLELARVLTAVAAVTTSLDDIIAATGLAGSAAAASLLELELAGFVQQVPGGYIRRPFPIR
jgi:DNA processing protein